MKVTLTFDNGPDPEVTPHVLSVLQRHGLPAHFFVVGSQVARHGVDHLAAAVTQGHRIGNHSYTHSTPLGLQPGDAGIGEVSSTRELIAPFTGGRRLFRPFGGQGRIGPHLLSMPVWNHLVQQGYSCVLWNCLAYEWEDARNWVAPTVARCLARDHAVVVLHDLPTGAMVRLDEFIHALKDAGASFELDFPEDCLPLDEGRPLWNATRLESIVASEGGRASAEKV